MAPGWGGPGGGAPPSARRWRRGAGCAAPCGVGRPARRPPSSRRRTPQRPWQQQRRRLGSRAPGGSSSSGGRPAQGELERRRRRGAVRRLLPGRRGWRRGRVVVSSSSSGCRPSRAGASGCAWRQPGGSTGWSPAWRVDSAPRRPCLPCRPQGCCRPSGRRGGGAFHWQAQGQPAACPGRVGRGRRRLADGADAPLLRAAGGRAWKCSARNQRSGVQRSTHSPRQTFGKHTVSDTVSDRIQLYLLFMALSYSAYNAARFEASVGWSSCLWVSDIHGLSLYPQLSDRFATLSRSQGVFSERSAIWPFPPTCTTPMQTSIASLRSSLGLVWS